jgi:peptidoglycan/xylan/chitin deacetylase (PgdA/CDA1 family)
VTLRRAAVAAAGVAAVLHAGPALAALAPVRRPFFPTLSGQVGHGGIALTFDDGPDPRSTPAFLDLLAERGVRATFFLLGRMVAAAPDLAARIVAEGHEVAVHGYTHRCLLARAPKSTMDDIERGMVTIAEASGMRPRWYRPPYGVLTGAALIAARRLDLQPVLWSAWGRDWTAASTPSSVLRTVHKGLGPGGTVLLHDSDCTSAPGSWRATLGALPHLLDDCARQGWSVGPLRQHGLPGATIAGS